MEYKVINWKIWAIWMSNQIKKESKKDFQCSYLSKMCLNITLLLTRIKKQ